MTMGQPRYTGWVSVWNVSNLQSLLSSWNIGWDVAGIAFSPDGSTISAIGTQYQWFGGMSGAYEPFGSYLSVLSTTAHYEES